MIGIATLLIANGCDFGALWQPRDIYDTGLQGDRIIVAHQYFDVLTIKSPTRMCSGTHIAHSLTYLLLFR